REFVFAGGLLVTLGGIPFRRTLARAADGGFDVEPALASALDLRDELRVAMAPKASALERTRIQLRAAPDCELLARFASLPPGRGPWLTRRTGRPRDERSLHRYLPLFGVVAGEQPIGDAAALVVFSGPHPGGLLEIALDAGGFVARPDEQASLAAESLAAAGQ